MPESGPISERRRQQNRDAQRTYRKSLLKRIEELESRQSLGVFELHTADTQGQSPPSLDKPQIDECISISPSPSMNGLTKQPVAHMNEHGSPLQYGAFPNSFSNEQPSFSPRESISFLECRPSISAYPDFEKMPIPKIQNPSSVYSLKGQDTPHIATGSRPSTASGGTALHAAIMSGNEAIIKLLLERKADPTALNQERKDALHLAVESGQANIVRMLLKAGAHVSSVDECGHTVLYKAIINGSEEIVRLLLDSGANVNQSVVFMQMTAPLAASNSMFSPMIIDAGQPE